jgi:lipoic acid synthetase
MTAMTDPRSRSFRLHRVTGSPLVAGAKQMGGDKIGRVRRCSSPTRRCCASPAGSACASPGNGAVAKLKAKLRENRLVTVCEEASCPNIHECFGHGTATFMILGEVCTRRCSFCDVAHGRPKPPDASEPLSLARPSPTWA